MKIQDNFSNNVIKALEELKEKIKEEANVVYSFTNEKPFHINVLLISNNKP